MTAFSPREIVSELDRFIVGQAEAKRAVAVALRDRWRRRQLGPELRDEATPKNILMIGPTGVGKTEISRRLAKLAGAPFIKVEATKFTEVGYVGRDVDSIVRDLVEIAIGLVRDKRRAEVRAKAEGAAEDRVLDALVGPTGGEAARESFRKKLRSGALDDREIEVEVADAGPSAPMMELPGGAGFGVGGPFGGGAGGGANIGEILSKAFGGGRKKRRMTVAESHAVLVAEEADKMLDAEQLARDAVKAVEENGIVFLDEIDKVAARSAEGRGPDVSREGVQRDLLPLIEGAVVPTKHGPVSTDHILFIASGAFHVAKPSDLLPELQGRLPIRVELKPLTEADFVAILTEPQNSLVRQTEALMATENVRVHITHGGVEAIAKAAADMNQAVENIGARRLHTVLERVLSDLSFNAPDLPPDQREVYIDADYVEAKLADLTRNQDLRRYIL